MKSVGLSQVIDSVDPELSALVLNVKQGDSLVCCHLPRHVSVSLSGLIPPQEPSGSRDLRVSVGLSRVQPVTLPKDEGVHEGAAIAALHMVRRKAL